MLNLRVAIVGYNPDWRSTIRTFSYATYALKAYLDRHIHEDFREYLDAEAINFRNGTAPGEMVVRILQNKPRLVGFSVYLWNYDEMVECARRIREISQDIVIVFGGPQVSSVSEEVMNENPQIDIISCAAFCGEKIFFDIVNVFLKGKDVGEVNGICYRDSKGSIVKTPSDTGPVDFSEIPSPYSGNDNIFQGNDNYMATIETSRGCVHDCSYCFWGAGMKGIKYFPLSRVLKDIETVCSNPNVKCLYFTDASILSNRRRAEEIINCVAKQKNPVEIICETDLMQLDESIAKLLLSAIPGFAVCAAIQTVNPKARALIGKARPIPSDYRNKVRKAREQFPEMPINVDVMLGLPGDDFEGFMMTLDFALSIKPNRIILNYPVYLLPGSAFYKDREVLGIRHTEKVPLAVIETRDFPREDIEKAMKISIWAQVLTQYYPAVRDFFYELTEGGENRIDRLLCWIDTIEKRKSLFSSEGDLIDMAVSSLFGWNKTKRALLEKSSTIEMANIIYSTVLELEKPYTDTRFGQRIQDGHYLCQNLYGDLHCEVKTGDKELLSTYRG